jgi:glycosyltransferase involved in cell wall biosynthesis
MGLPVIGSPFGSLPELITPDVGIICQSYEELLEALSSPRPAIFKAEKIRSYVEQRFNICNFTTKYLELYKQVIKGISLNPTPPTLQTGKRPEDILPF